MPHDVVIIGGGIAGLSAAVDLSGKGKRVLLLEQKPHLGGRTYSFIDKRTGDAVDNGQHLLMGCYHSTIRYLNTIGASSLAYLQPNLQIHFLHPQNGFTSLTCPPLPAPLHVLVGLLRLNTLPLTHRLRLLRIGTELIGSSVQKERELANLTVDQWLSSLGQTKENRKYLWDILAVGTLNDDPALVSALLFYRVLKAAFLGERRNSSLLVPRVGLSEFLVDPAVAYIASKGGEIRTGARVESILVKKGLVDGVRVGGKKLKASSYICAVPYHALDSLVNSDELGIRSLSEFTSSPIMTLHLWLDRPVIRHEFTATLDSTIQWVFNKTRMVHGVNLPDKQYLSIVISGAGKYVHWSGQKLVSVAWKELCAMLPTAKKAKVTHSLVIKEKRATFSPKPGLEAFRPDTRTSVANLFLAGDWTNTGFPATIEGAVMSGFKAAHHVLSL